MAESLQEMLERLEESYYQLSSAASHYKDTLIDPAADGLFESKAEGDYRQKRLEFMHAASAVVPLLLPEIKQLQAALEQAIYTGHLSIEDVAPRSSDDPELITYSELLCSWRDAYRPEDFPELSAILRAATSKETEGGQP